MHEADRHTWAESRSNFKDDQRRLITRSALAILMEEGTPGLTMASLAASAGISRQTLYRYFPDLDAVLAASVDGLEEADQQFRELVFSEGTAREQLHRAVDALIDVSAHGGGQIDEFIAALPPSARAAITAHRRRTADLVAELLTTLKSERRSKYVGEPSLDAELILGLVTAAHDASRTRTHAVVDLMLDAQPS